MHKQIKFVQDTDRAVMLMHQAGSWLKETGKNPSKWWDPRNLNHEFLLKHAEASEFYVGLVEGEAAVTAILQTTERNQSWEFIDKGVPRKAVYIHWLAINRKFAGQNLAGKLIEFAAAYAMKLGYKLVRLDTDADNQKLMQVYKDLDFDLMGIEENENHRTAYFQKQT